MKFDCKVSKTVISILDTGVHIKNKPYAKIFKKQTNRQSFLHKDLEQQSSLQDRNPYIQALKLCNMKSLSFTLQRTQTTTKDIKIVN